MKLLWPMPGEICVIQLMKGCQVSGQVGGERWALRRATDCICSPVKSICERGQRLPSEAQFIFEATINKRHYRWGRAGRRQVKRILTAVAHVWQHFVPSEYAHTFMTNCAAKQKKMKIASSGAKERQRSDDLDSAPHKWMRTEREQIREYTEGKQSNRVWYLKHKCLRRLIWEAFSQAGVVVDYFNTLRDIRAQNIR